MEASLVKPDLTPRGLFNYVYFCYCTIGSAKHWIVESTSPDRYFMNYAELLQLFADLSGFEGQYDFYNPFPSQELEVYRTRFIEFTDDFLFRVWALVLEQASRLKTLDGRNRKISSFFTDMAAYSGYFHENNFLTLEILRCTEPDLNNLPKRTPKPRPFDTEMEQELLRQLGASKSEGAVSFYYCLNHLIDFYYLYRNEYPELGERCLKLCEETIAFLPYVNEKYTADSIDSLKLLSDNHPDENLDEKISEARRLGFRANIPAFDRLSMLLIAKGQYEEAAQVCRDAIAHDSNTERMHKRLLRIEKLALKGQ